MLENEFLAVKLTNTVPELVVCVYYGTQASTFGVDQVKFHLSELFLEIQKHTILGANVQLVRDLLENRKLIPQNHPFMNPNERLFLDMLENNRLDIMNTISKEPITFVDQSSENHKRCFLDLVTTNFPSNVSDFRTDNEDLLIISSLPMPVNT